jgi:hypothetical protein
MGERLRLIAEQQCDIAGSGLLFQQAKAQAAAVDGIGIPSLRPSARSGVMRWIACSWFPAGAA